MRKVKFVVLVITIVFLAQLLFFYRGVYLPPPTNMPDFLSITTNSSTPIEINDSFISGNGTVLVDLSHENNFNVGDLNILLSRIIARGYHIEYLHSGSNLTDHLSDSTSFVVISPTSSFLEADVNLVREFIDGGGRLLLLSEPINKNKINSLAVEFGTLFWNDYLYNLKENDGNFRYIYLTEFVENNITNGLRKIVFYTSSSVFGNGIIFTDNNTYSSSSGEKGRYSVVVMNEDSRVLAIGDVTFLAEPYNVMDNNRLICNIADFLAPPDATPEPAEIYSTTVNSTNKTLTNDTIFNASMQE